MSRGLILGILAALVALLAVMSQMVAPRGPEPPKQLSEVEKKRQEEQARQAQESILKKEQGEVKTAAQSPPGAARPQPGRNLPPKPSNTPSPRAMQITNKWYLKREPGTTGLKTLEEQDKKQQAEWDRMMKDMAHNPPKPVPVHADTLPPPK